MIAAHGNPVHGRRVVRGDSTRRDTSNERTNNPWSCRSRPSRTQTCPMADRSAVDRQRPGGRWRSKRGSMGDARALRAQKSYAERTRASVVHQVRERYANATGLALTYVTVKLRPPQTKAPPRVARHARGSPYYVKATPLRRCRARRLPGQRAASVRAFPAPSRTPDWPCPLSRL